LKRAAAILLLILFLFNWFGYRLLSGYLQTQADARLEARLDQEQYDPAQLIEMRVPLNMPYQLNSPDFERYDGEIEIDGVHYKYVKRKVENGHLVLLCLPNETKMRIQGAREEFFKMVNDLPAQGKSTGHTIKNPVTEYWQQEYERWALPSLHFLRPLFTLKNTIIPSAPAINTPAQPPEC
jgi:hypothetical protein